MPVIINKTFKQKFQTGNLRIKSNFHLRKSAEFKVLCNSIFLKLRII